METPYIPIACSLHDEYEIAIMKKAHLALQWQDDDGNAYNGNVLPTDLQVKNKEEYLVFVDQSQKGWCVRLDRVALLPL